MSFAATAGIWRRHLGAGETGRALDELGCWRAQEIGPWDPLFQIGQGHAPALPLSEERGPLCAECADDCRRSFMGTLAELDHTPVFRQSLGKRRHGRAGPPVAAPDFCTGSIARKATVAQCDPGASKTPDRTRANRSVAKRPERLTAEKLNFVILTGLLAR